MKKYYFVVAALTVMAMVACESENIEERNTEKKIGVYKEVSEMVNLAHQIDSLTDHWPVYKFSRSTRLDQQGYITLPTEENRRLNVVKIDYYGARLGACFGGFWGAVAGGTASSLIAYIVNKNNPKNGYVTGNWSAFKEQSVYTIGETSNLTDSTGYFHNQIIRQIGEEKLKNTNVENVYELVTETMEQLYGKRSLSFPLEQLKNDSQLNFLKNNMSRLVTANSNEEFFGILYENQNEDREKLDIFKTYMDGLSVVDDVDGVYTKKVLDCISQANIDSSTKAELQNSVLVGNASNMLWKIK